MPKKLMAATCATAILLVSCGAGEEPSERMTKSVDVTGADQFCLKNPLKPSAALSEENLWDTYNHFALCEGDVATAATYIDVLVEMGNGEAMYVKANSLWDSDRERSMSLIKRAADLQVTQAKEALERIKAGGRL